MYFEHVYSKRFRSTLHDPIKQESYSESKKRSVEVLPQINSNKTTRKDEYRNCQETFFFLLPPF